MAPTTDPQPDLIRLVAFYISAIPGTIVCGLVLLAYAVVAKNREARTFLDRVSFRLLVYSLISNVLYGITYVASPLQPGRACDFNAFFINLTLLFAIFVTTCIAINLQLVLVHSLDGTKYEKYYLMGSAILSLALTVPALALHQFGWDKKTSTCWYTNEENAGKLRWIVGTHTLWVALAAGIETISSMTILVWLFRARRSIANLAENIGCPSICHHAPVSASDWRGLWSPGSTRFSLVGRHSKYRRVILRIALYPIISLILNITNVILDHRITVTGSPTGLDFRLLLLDLVLYGIRTLVYGLIAAADPAFINALQKVRSRCSGNAVEVTLSQVEEGRDSLEPERITSGSTSVSPYKSAENMSELVVPRKSDAIHQMMTERFSLDQTMDQIRDFERQL